MRQDFISIFRYIATIDQNTDKYFSTIFEQEKLNSNQQYLLLNVYEHPGISLQDLAHQCHFNKAAVTKNVQKLVEEQYLSIQVDEKDHRKRHLYTTTRFEQRLEEILKIRQWWMDQLFFDYSKEEATLLTNTLKHISQKSEELIKQITQQTNGSEK